MAEAAKLYLGRTLGASGERGIEVHLDPADLTTHAFVVGMTGSGKTGLGIDLLEEAALAGIPALAVDPKGELGNLALTFPDLRSEDFLPWLPPGEAERQGLSPEAHARAVADRWREGLAEWGIGAERIRAFRESAEVTVYTPGSRAGTSVDVLSSLAAPALSWEAEEEALLESIRVSVSALLALLGVEADPLKSREHIFLSHLVERAWRAGAACDVAALIGGLQQPPFEKLGVFDVESFFPTKERMKLAVALNGILAAPGFAAWTEGEALDVGTLLRTAEGRPRIAVFHLGHLAEGEKLFFTTLLLSAVNVWMRRQGGTTDLRALVYVDEVVGMIPPHPANPPTKEILLLLMKQARAFGLGLVLATQNPVDVDYKVLTNAGTWCVGRLQTQNDKDRVLEGLVGQVRDGASRPELDRAIGALPKRAFLLHSTRGTEPLTFQTRWAMSYLRGPLTREEIARLRPAQLAGAAAAAAPPKPAPAASPATVAASSGAAATGAGQPPPAPSGAAHLFLTPEGLHGLGSVEPVPEFVAEPIRWIPGLYSAAALRYDEARAGLDLRELAERLIFPLPDAVPVWERSRTVALGAEGTSSAPPGIGSFDSLPAWLLQKGRAAALRRAFAEHLLATSTLELHLAPALRLYSRHDETRADFEGRVSRERAARRDAEVAKLRERYATRLATLQRKLEKERADAAAADAAHSGRKREEVVSGAESVFGFLLGRKGTRAISQASRQRRMTENARLRAERERDELEYAESALAALGAELEAEVREIEERHLDEAVAVESRPVPLERDDVRVEVFAILWVPVRG
ncbi:MAG: helicase HerA domain-containing protein [Gemmatimonadota bacterium]